MDESSADQVARSSGLPWETCVELMKRGWVYVQESGEKPMWVSPSAGLPEPIIHHEPRCEDACINMAPHVHGLRCDSRCKECHGVCHPNCPAYKE